MPADPVAAARALRARCPTGASVAADGARRSSRTSARAGTRRWRSTRRASPAPQDRGRAAARSTWCAALRLAYDNVFAVAHASLAGDRDVELPQGQTVRVREVPVAARGDLRARRAGAVPVLGRDGRRHRARGGRRATSRSAPAHPVMAAAAELCGADEVHAMGGAQAIAALAYGTETIAPVDVIVGPGSLYAQEAKRQVAGVVGIDGFAGPSDLVIIASESSAGVALDALAQAEHGAGTVGRRRLDDAEILRGPAGADGARSADWTTRWRSARRSRPSTCSWWAPRRRRSRRACATPAPSSSARRPAPRSATTSRARTTSCPRRARRASRPASTCATSRAS